MGTQPRLIYCADGNPTLARLAVEAGWLYGARLPATVYESVYFADQDWKQPDREGYMAGLALHRPAMATILDWEREEQLPEVLSWAEEAAALVGESVVLIPKVPGSVPRLPRVIAGRRVILGYSVPTSYGASPLGLWEFAGWPVHLLGGSPQRQMECWRYLSGIADVVSADGNMMGQQARRGRFWCRERSPSCRSRWWQLRETGDNRTEGTDRECFRRSCANILETWQTLGGPPE